MRPQIAVIDPARALAELPCYNRLALTAPLPTTYHLPQMFGTGSLEALDPTFVRGLVILGSASSVNERAPWQTAFEAWLRPWLERGVPTLGICYGHQMLAHMFDGRVDYAFPGQIKKQGFRAVRFAASLLGPAEHGELVVSHCEAVVEAPASMRVIATSDDVAVEGLQHERLPIVSLQAHPEATPEFLTSHEIPLTGVPRLAFGHALVARFLEACARR
jgi:GMP synthase (glutamine-hydrolysing)